jgi:hypothetical protein
MTGQIQELVQSVINGTHAVAFAVRPGQDGMQRLFWLQHELNHQDSMYAFNANPAVRAGYAFGLVRGLYRQMREASS